MSRPVLSVLLICQASVTTLIERALNPILGDNYSVNCSPQSRENWKRPLGDVWCIRNTASDVTCCDFPECGRWQQIVESKLIDTKLCHSTSVQKSSYSFRHLFVIIVVITSLKYSSSEWHGHRMGQGVGDEPPHQKIVSKFWRKRRWTKCYLGWGKKARIFFASQRICQTN